MAAWQKTSSEVQKDFIEAPGNVEATMDGTSVNTTEGWREVKVGIASKRELAKGVLPEQWGERELPRHTARVAFAAIEDRRQIADGRRQQSKWLRRLYPAVCYLPSAVSLRQGA